MITAIIDLGTNTFNLLIAEVTPSATKKIFKTKMPVKLGEGGINANVITEAAFDRGLKALEAYSEEITKHHANKVVAFATSAIRSATNGSDFVRAARERTGIEITVIPGEREAELIYTGVRNALALGWENSLIMDIGGGSTEFIIGNENKIAWKYSFQLGASRLIERFRPSDPIKNKEVEEIRAYLKAELSPLFAAVKKHPVKELVGSSGSFDSLAEIIANKYYSPDILKKKTEYAFNLNDCEVVYHELLRSTRAERLKMKGLIEMRVDMIVVSGIFVHFILGELGIRHMRLSTYSLKEGVLSEIAEGKL